ncbi:MAG: formylglycine-generating enzyme family protein [Gemmataceae bacterium]
MSNTTDSYPSSGLFAELSRLRGTAPGRERSARIWQVLGCAYGNADLPVLLDFALEHGLVNHCEETRQRAQRGGEVRHLVWTSPADGCEMVWIPADRFFVGPKQDKRIAQSAGFSLARHPVTNGQFARFVAETDYDPPPAHPDRELFLSHWRSGKVPKKLEKHPVVWVSYLDALAYCDWAGATLPTEWLWEKAARGPDGPPFPWGDKSPLPGHRGEKITLANVRSQGSCAVGSFPRTRTAYGCEDMVGNVSEWCRMTDGDDYGRFPEHRPEIRVPAPGELVYAAVRGSCFLRSSHSRMSAWHRRRLSGTRRNRWVGFRPACFLPCFPA